MYTRSFRDVIDEAENIPKEKTIYTGSRPEIQEGSRIIKSLEDRRLFDEFQTLSGKYTEKDRRKLAEYLFWWAIEEDSILKDKSFPRAVDMVAEERLLNKEINGGQINEYDKNEFIGALFRQPNPESFMEYLLGQEQWEILQDNIRQKNPRLTARLRKDIKKGFHEERKRILLLNN